MVNRKFHALAGLVLVFALANVAQAQRPSGTLYASSDVTTSLGEANFADEDVILDDGSGNFVRVPFVSLPRSADLVAYHLETNGDHLLAFGTIVSLPGNLSAEPRDVIRFDGALYWVEFDGSQHGVPAGAGIDAVSRSKTGDLLLSFDTAVDMAADEDIVQFDGAAFSHYFDGSSAGVGVAPELDLDALHRLPNNHLLVSFDGPGNFAGFGYADEDLLEFAPETGIWQLAFDASAAATPWPASSDLDAIAVPEPGANLMLVLGVPAVFLLARRRTVT